MSNVIKIKKISELPTDLYNHILENNINFGKRCGQKPRIPENYENIIIAGDFKNHYTIYGDLNYLGISMKNLESMSCARIFAIANCFVDNKNCIKKNRWGDSDYE